VINLSGEGHLEKLGPGYGGVLEIPNYLVCACGAASLSEVVATVYKNWYSVLSLSF
jgi:hypothetical protein